MKPTRVHSVDATQATKLRARIAARSMPAEGGCREWHGALDRYGYGKIKVVSGGIQRLTGPHRAAWLAEVGPINGDLVIDHLCRNRRCVNVAHMELVTNAENTLRQDHSNKKGRSGTRPGREVHQCGRHGREDGALSVTRSGYNYWRCRICARERSRRHLERKAAALSAD